MMAWYQLIKRHFWAQTKDLSRYKDFTYKHLLRMKNYSNTVQSRFSDFKFSDNLWFSDYHSGLIINVDAMVTILQRSFFNSLNKIIQFSHIM